MRAKILKASCILVLIVMLGGSVVVQAANVELKYFSDSKKVIPITARYGAAYYQTDVAPPNMIVTNNGTTVVTIRGATVIGLVGGEEAVAYRLSADNLRVAMAKANASINNLVAQKLEGTLHFTYGNFVLPEGPLATDTTIAPGQSALLPLPSIMHVSYIGPAWLDALKLEIATDDQTIIMPIEMTFYATKGKYIFPLKGDVHIAGLPGNPINHRHSASQEFAFDVIGMGAAGNFSSKESKTDGVRLEDHHIFNREVLAVADGIVVATGTRFPEAPTRDKDYGAKYMALARNLFPKIGYVNTIAGNNVVIDHGNGEYSFYAHMREGSVSVKPGDRVKQGQVIGRVGNSGNSSAPHLHFQLIDSPDMLVANGLPITFTNVPLNKTYMSGAYHDANGLLYTDDLYLHID